MASRNRDWVQTFYPSMDDFQDTERFASECVSKAGNRTGICKISPPKEWYKMRQKCSNLDDMIIPNPIKQQMHGENGIYTMYKQPLEEMTVGKLKEMTLQNKADSPFDYKDLARLQELYWSGVSKRRPIYGADVNKSLFPKDFKPFNVGNLGTKLDTVKEYLDTNIAGVNSSYLYFGTWGSTFPWHTEDLDLYSLNYLHYGAPKFWYSVAPKYGKQVEKLLDKFFPMQKRKCSGYIRHKTCLISPMHLKRAGIPFNMTLQQPGEIILTFPYGYHAGFNTGFNCAEATNLASDFWIPYGKNSMDTRCVCKDEDEAVAMPMDPFVKTYESAEDYKYWQKHGKGKPIDYTACPPPPSPIDRPKKWRDEIALKMKKYNKPLIKAGKRPIRYDEFLWHTTPVELTDEDVENFKYDDGEKSMKTIAAFYNDQTEESGEPDSSIADEVLVRLVKVEEIARDEDKALESVREKSKNRSMKFSKEKYLNMEQGEVAPYCSLCHVVKPLINFNAVYENLPAPVDTLIELKTNEEDRFTRSSVEIQEKFFQMKSKTGLNASGGLDPEEYTISPLLDCDTCNVRVHAKCYGVSDEVLDALNKHPDKTWRCNRCRADGRKIFCCCCDQVFGVLKRVVGDGNRWAHLECVLATDGAFFEDVERREGINLSNLQGKNAKKKCKYCDKKTGHAVPCCVRDPCCSTKDYFHVTCARDNGNVIETGDCPYSIGVFCEDCREMDMHEKPILPLKCGDEVKVKNGRNGYQDAVVTDAKIVVHHKADFVVDKSKSKKVFKKDVINFDWSKYQTINELIEIKCGSLGTRQAYYRGFDVIQVYAVKPEAGKIIHNVTRDKLLDLDQYAGQVKSGSIKIKSKRGKKRKQNGDNKDGSSTSMAQGRQQNQSSKTPKESGVCSEH